MNKAFQSIRNWFKSDSSAQETVSFGLVAPAMPICPVCNLPASQHDYQQIASATFKEGNEGTLKALEEAFVSRDWITLSGLQGWEGLNNNADVILLRCPDDRYNLTIIYDPFELFENPSLLRHQEVAANDLPLVKGEWKKVGSTQKG